MNAQTYFLFKNQSSYAMYTKDYSNYAYKILNEKFIPVVSVIETGSFGNDIVIHWAEIRLI